jgi:hypothetical protein
LPTSSTTQTDVSSTETSKPTKCAIAAAPSPMLEVRPTPDPSSYVKGLHVHRWKDQAQPPRYTIFRATVTSIRMAGMGAKQPGGGNWPKAE